LAGLTKYLNVARKFPERFALVPSQAQGQYPSYQINNTNPTRHAPPPIHSDLIYGVFPRKTTKHSPALPESIFPIPNKRTEERGANENEYINQCP